MRKTRILIASVLKPVNDTRMFEKFGQSLAKLPETEIHIAGFSAKMVSNFSEITFHPIFSFSRLSFGRILAQWKYYKLLVQLKPEVIIANTFELLPVTLLYRIFFSTVILYDVRENYYANIRFQPTFPKPFRALLANGVRLIEKFSALFIGHFFLAERSYADELSFIRKDFTILENKFKSVEPFHIHKEFPVKITPEKLHFLYSGTITEIYGIWEALELVQKLYDLNNCVTFTIIGFCPQESTYNKLKEAIVGKTYINLIGGKELVPHSLVIEEIQKATIGLLPYHANPSTQNCIPTKLYEYLANGLPVIIPTNKRWEQEVQISGAGFSLDFDRIEPQNILNRLVSSTFYPGGIPSGVFWSKEEVKLLSYFNGIA